MNFIPRECREQQQQEQQYRHHDDCECKPKRHRSRYNRRRSQYKRSYQRLSSRCRDTTIVSAGAIIVAIAATASCHRANALSLINAARRATETGTSRSRHTASDAKTAAVSTTPRSFTTGMPPAASFLALPSAASVHDYMYGDLVDSTPCLGHASTDASGPLSDDSNNSSNRNGTPRRINYFVVGTSHFRCDSAGEVERIIREIGPDGVVIEPKMRGMKVSLCTVQDPGF